MLLSHFLRRSQHRAENLYGEVDWSQSFVFVRFTEQPVGLGYTFHEILRSDDVARSTSSGTVTPVTNLKQLHNLVIGKISGAEVLGFVLYFPEWKLYGLGLVVTDEIFGVSRITFCDLYTTVPPDVPTYSNLMFPLVGAPPSDELLLAYFLRSFIQTHTMIEKHRRLETQPSFNTLIIDTVGKDNYSLVKEAGSLPAMLAGTPDVWDTEIQLPLLTYKKIEVLYRDPEKPSVFEYVPLFRDSNEEKEFLRAKFGELENFRFRYVLTPSLFEVGLSLQLTPVLTKDLRRKG
jgi:hypothetical protein